MKLIGFADCTWDFQEAVRQQIKKEDALWYAQREAEKFETVKLTLPTQKWTYTGQYGFAMGVLRFTRGALMP